MADITFPISGADGDWVTVDSADIAGLEQAGGLTIVRMNSGQTYRSPAPIELLQQGWQSGEQPVEPLPPTDPVALARSPFVRP